jgi:hypothetical protein
MSIQGLAGNDRAVGNVINLIVASKRKYTNYPDIVDALDELKVKVLRLYGDE